MMILLLQCGYFHFVFKCIKHFLNEFPFGTPVTQESKNLLLLALHTFSSLTVQSVC
jgi:hypothetical protein